MPLIGPRSVMTIDGSAVAIAAEPLIAEQEANRVKSRNRTTLLVVMKALLLSPQ